MYEVFLRRQAAAGQQHIGGADSCSVAKGNSDVVFIIPL